MWSGLADENEYLLAFDDGMSRGKPPKFWVLTHLQGILKQLGKCAFRVTDQGLHKLKVQRLLLTIGLLIPPSIYWRRILV